MKAWLPVLMIAVVSVASLALLPWIGPGNIQVEEIFSDGPAAMIFWQVRVPRLLLAWLCGGSLAVCGMAFQAIFRNPLATPFTLGVSAGASFGASLALRLGLGLAGGTMLAVGSFIGSLLAISMVYGLANLRRGLPTATLLLAGVAVNFLFSSLILLIQFTGDFAETMEVLRWTMGSLQIVGHELPARLAVVSSLLVLVLFCYRRTFDLLLTGEDLAASRGIDVNRLKTSLFLVLSLAIASVVAACGPIGFIGLIGPHIARLLADSNHTRLLPASFFFGGALLAICDTLARTVLAPAELPVGIFTALLGAPFFLFLLLRGTAERRVI